MKKTIKIIVNIAFFATLVSCGGGGGSSTSTTTTTYTYTVTTFAGSTTSGLADGITTAATFNSPLNIAVDTSNNLYVTDYSNNEIRKITSAGVVTTFAGSSTSGFTNGVGNSATFNGPWGVGVDSSGNVYIADRANNAIRKITSAGVVTTFAGQSTSGSADGTGTSASFNAPLNIAVDGSGNLFVADYYNNEIRKITSSGVVTTFAGSTTSGSADGTGTAATFNGPTALAFDSSGNLFVTDRLNNMIRKITSTGVVTTFAGQTTSGSADGTGTAASFNAPIGITIDSSDNLYVTDMYNNEIRKITTAGVVTTIIGTTSSGSANGVGTAATLNGPWGIAKDSSGNLYIADRYNNQIRKVTITTN